MTSHQEEGKIKAEGPPIRNSGDTLISFAGKITQKDREEKLKQKGAMIWFTGLSGSGKTTLSSCLGKYLFDKNFLVYVLDGDRIRQGLSSDLGFKMEDREENIRRIGEVARLFADAALIVIVAFIPPFRKDRDRIRESMSLGRFIEIFVDCPIEICEDRDTKGMYQKARKGEIKDFTGISSPYEKPVTPEIHLRTDQHSVEQCLKIIIDHLSQAGLLSLK